LQKASAPPSPSAKKVAPRRTTHAVNAEIRDLFDAGADVVQIDEPYMQAHPDEAATRIRRALPYVPARNIIVSTDCGMKYLPREVAAGKLAALVAGARLVREELAPG
jgi:methionine synthase II (cobalamin-independent)